jgi:hypothetical protein
VESSHALTSYETGIAPTKPMPSVAGVKVTLGGFIAAESVYRTHNQVADMGSTFNAIPYPFSPLYREHEFHASARGPDFLCWQRARSIPRRAWPPTSKPTSWAWRQTPTTLKPTIGRLASGRPF